MAWKNENLPVFGCLDDVKVVHITSSLAGPYAAQLLADYGADVLWLENPMSPDISRFGGGLNVEAERRNQREISLNIATEEGRDVFLKIIKDSDIFIESSKGGQYDKLGYSDETLWEVNPALVIVHVSGFGQTGLPEYVGRASYDAVAQAFGGLTDANRNPVTPPYPVGPYSADYTSALYATIGALTALHKARTTGKGESVDVAQYEAVARSQVYQPDWFTNHIVKEIAGYPPINAGWGCFPCKDGAYMQTCLLGAGVLRKAIPFFGLEYGSELFPEGCAILQFGRDPGAEAFDQAIKDYLLSHDSDEAQAALLEMKLPVQKVNTMADLENNPHVQARGLIQEWTSRKGETLRSVGVVPKFKKFPGKTWAPCPEIGQHNDEVLAELGYSADEVAALYEKKVITKR
jgi:L-carnitine CoA-transferase